MFAGMVIIYIFHIVFNISICFFIGSILELFYWRFYSRVGVCKYMLHFVLHVCLDSNIVTRFVTILTDLGMRQFP